MDDYLLGIEGIACMAHELNRTFCRLTGDDSQLPWAEAPDWQQDSAINGVMFHLSGDHGPEASHESWIAQKVAEGWKYGPVKDAQLKEHPCMVPYSALPANQRIKDYLFANLVKAFKECQR